VVFIDKPGFSDVQYCYYYFFKEVGNGNDCLGWFVASIGRRTFEWEEMGKSRPLLPGRIANRGNSRSLQLVPRQRNLKSKLLRGQLSLHRLGSVLFLWNIYFSAWAK
jgi:hypothetical protein